MCERERASERLPFYFLTDMTCTPPQAPATIGVTASAADAGPRPRPHPRHGGPVNYADYLRRVEAYHNVADTQAPQARASRDPALDAMVAGLVHATTPLVYGRVMYQASAAPAKHSSPPPPPPLPSATTSGLASVCVWGGRGLESIEDEGSQSRLLSS